MTQQRSTGSKTRLSCSHVHEKNTHPVAQARRHDSRAPMYMKRTHTLANKGSRKREPHKLMLKTWRTLETRQIVQQCAQQHILLNHVCMQTKKGTKLLNHYRRSQGYQKTWSAQRIETIVKHASRPLLQNTTVDCSYNSRQKLRHPWPTGNVETQKLSHTEGRKNNTHIDKMSRPCRHFTKHGSFHMVRGPGLSLSLGRRCGLGD